MTDAQVRSPIANPFGGFRKRTYRLGPLLKDLGHLAAHPLRLNAIFLRGEVEPRLREQIMCAVATTNDCRYCLAIHHQFGLATGSTDEELQAIGAGNLRSIDALDGALISYAVELVEVDFAHSAPVRTSAAQHLPASVRRDVELIARFMTLANRSGNTFDALRARRRGVTDPTGSLPNEMVISAIYLLGGMGPLVLAARQRNESPVALLRRLLDQDPTATASPL